MNFGYMEVIPKQRLRNESEEFEQIIFKFFFHFCDLHLINNLLFDFPIINYFTTL